MAHREELIGRYRHYKGKEYQVIAVGFHTETREEVVIYQAKYFVPDLGEDSWWVRPLSMFIEEVEVDGKMVPRFQKI